MCVCHYISLFHHNFIMFRCQRPRYAYRRFFGSIFAVVHRYGSWHDENVRDPKMLPEVPKSMCWKNVPNVQNVRNVRNVHNVHRIVSQRLNGTPIDYLTWGNHEAWTAQCVHSLKFFQVFESIGLWVCQCKTGRKLQPASSNSLLQEQNAGHGRTSSPQRYL